jgi:preprotein translocase subunit SecE
MLPVKQWWPTMRDFFRDVWNEMRKVSWPGRPEVVGTTIVVIVACFLFGFYLFLVDTGLAWLVDRIFKATGVVGA